MAKDTLMERGEMIVLEGHSCEKKLLIRSEQLGFRGEHCKRKSEREDDISRDRLTLTSHYRGTPLAKKDHFVFG